MQSGKLSHSLDLTMHVPVSQRNSFAVQFLFAVGKIDILIDYYIMVLLYFDMVKVMIMMIYSFWR